MTDAASENKTADRQGSRLEFPIVESLGRIAASFRGCPVTAATIAICIAIFLVLNLSAESSKQELLRALAGHRKRRTRRRAGLRLPRRRLRERRQAEARDRRSGLSRSRHRDGGRVYAVVDDVAATGAGPSIRRVAPRSGGGRRAGAGDVWLGHGPLAHGPPASHAMATTVGRGRGSNRNERSGVVARDGSRRRHPQRR